MGGVFLPLTRYYVNTSQENLMTTIYIAWGFSCVVEAVNYKEFSSFKLTRQQTMKPDSLSSYLPFEGYQNICAIILEYKAFSKIVTLYDTYVKLKENFTQLGHHFRAALWYKNMTDCGNGHIFLGSTWSSYPPRFIGINWFSEKCCQVSQNVHVAFSWFYLFYLYSRPKIPAVWPFSWISFLYI